MRQGFFFLTILSVFLSFTSCSKLGMVKLTEEQIQNGNTRGKYTFLGTGYIAKEKKYTTINDNNPAPEGATIIKRGKNLVYVTEKIPSDFLTAVEIQPKEQIFEKIPKKERNIVLNNPGTWCQIFPWNIPDENGLTDLDKLSGKK